jgi:cytochrome P450
MTSTPATTTAFPEFRPGDADFYQADPDAAFARLRAEDPLHWYEPARFWCITRHADVQEVGRRPRLFCSSRGTQLFEVLNGGPTGPGNASALPENIIRMDPPKHNVHRKLVMGSFTPARIAAMEPLVRAIAKRSLDAIDPSTTVDLVEQVAVPTPMFVIAEMLGVPEEDYAAFRRWSDAIVEAGAGIISPETATAVGELINYIAEVAQERRRAPKDDLISLLLAAEVEGEKLTDPEVGMFCMTLLVAGNETTRNLVSGGALALMRNPEQHEALIAEPALLQNAVEEMLRYVSPIRNFARCATQDTELHGRQVRKGDYLVFFYSSANRDEEVFGADADAFDIRREKAPRHIAFGFGEHLCLGASLARLEARVMFEELLARWPRFSLAGEPEPLMSSLMNGLVHLPVTLAP